MDASAFGNSLNCSICLDVFKEPVVPNSCGHSVCSICIKNLIEASSTRRSVVCPQCRIVSWVPSGGFKKNHTLSDIINQTHSSTMSAETAKYVGKWRFAISENYDEYLRELGVNTVIRKVISLAEAGSAVQPVLLDIEVNGEHWKMTTTTASSNDSHEFDLHKKDEVTVIGGRKKVFTFDFIGGKLTGESKKIDPKDKNSKSEWHLEEGMLVVTMETETGVKAKKIYKCV